MTGADRPTVVAQWSPRSDEWRSRPLSPFAGRPNRPLLIGGCPRSGTTLLRSLLNNHPDIAIPAETNFVIPMWRFRVGFGDLRDPRNRRKIADWLFLVQGRGGERIRAGLSIEEATQRVVDAPPTLGSIIAELFQMYADVFGKPRWGDKRPGYAPHIRTVFSLLPEAQFVNVVRDPRGAVASQIPLGWDEPHVAVASAAVTWETAVRRVDAFADELRPDQLLDVRYEDLVRDPRGTLERICAFAGLRDGECVDEMLERERRGVYREGWHELVRKPISTKQVAAWRERLRPRDVVLVEEVTGAFFERFGYVPEPGLTATPTRFDRAEVRIQRRRRRRRWRRLAIDEHKRRLILSRGPIAALPAARRARAVTAAGDGAPTVTDARPAPAAGEPERVAGTRAAASSGRAGRPTRCGPPPSGSCETAC